MKNKIITKDLMLRMNRIIEVKKKNLLNAEIRNSKIL